MFVDGINYRSIEANPKAGSVRIIDQTLLPHKLEFIEIRSLDEAVEAISSMKVRGAPLIGAMAAYGLWLGLIENTGDESLSEAVRKLKSSRPTAVNLAWALDRVFSKVIDLPVDQRADAAFREAELICAEDIEVNMSIGKHGMPLIEEAWELAGKKRPVNILTHCNAGWLATVDRGTALAPVFAAHEKGIPLHVWVDETRPRLQGALTVWELAGSRIPCTAITDNAGGHLMQRAKVDLCIVGTDRTTACGDVCNKIGTYLKALAARDCGIPFYVALPHSTIDWDIFSGEEIPIENRDEKEVTRVSGLSAEGDISSVEIFPVDTSVLNPAFDITPARLVTALITDRGVCPATAEGLCSLFPEYAGAK